MIENVVDSVPDEPRYGKANAEHLASTWLTFVGAGIGTAIGAYAGYECVGFIFGLCSHDPLTGEKYGTAYFWAVMPEYRGNDTAYKLLACFEHWVKEQGGVAVAIGIIESPKAKKLARAHGRKGYALASHSMMKRLD